jgi:hypothetical protein
MDISPYPDYGAISKAHPSSRLHSWRDGISGGAEKLIIKFAMKLVDEFL